MPVFRSYLSIPAGENWGLAARNTINSLLRGKINVAGEVTLAPNSPTTILDDQIVGTSSVIVLMPMSANAAAAFGDLWFSAPVKGSVMINHADNGQTDRTFRYIVIG